MNLLLIHSTSAHLGGPAHIIKFTRLLLFAVGLHRCSDRPLPRSALAAGGSCSPAPAEGVGGVPLPDAPPLRSVVRQHLGQTLAAVQLLDDAGAGQTVTGQDFQRLGGCIAIGLTSDQRGRGGVFKELTLSAAVQFLQVFVEERRQVDLQDRDTTQVNLKPSLEKWFLL